MLDLFNYNMYDHVRARAFIGSRLAATAERINVEEEEVDLVQVLDDVEELFGEPIFLPCSYCLMMQPTNICASCAYCEFCSL